jgi:predicted DNA-binding transcriptional regulator AlpA
LDRISESLQNLFHRETPLIKEDQQPMRSKDLKEFDDLPNAAHVDVHVVAILFGCKPPTVWSRLRRKELPEPKKFGSHTRWNVGELRAALNTR